MYHFQLEERRRSDYFPAQNIALQINGPKAEKSWFADEVLHQRYPRRKASVIITPHDPDHGALGGEQLKAGLKAKTMTYRRKRRKR